MWTGILVGFVFGFILKRARFCFTGTIRDVLLERKFGNAWVFFSMIFIQSTLYFLFVQMGMIPAPTVEQFSIWSIVIGGLIFGYGAVMGNGCCGIAYLKVGDGRPTGMITLTTFALSAAMMKQGFLSPINAALNETGVVEADLANSLPLNPLYIAIILMVISVGLMFNNQRKQLKVMQPPSEHTGLRHIFFEKVWSKQWAAVLIGLVAGWAWLSSNLAGRNGGLGITTPTISWLNFFAGGLNELNWASFLLVGIIVGTFVATFGSNEFSFKQIDSKTMFKSAFSGVLMGTGAVLASGCTIGHALVGTSIFAMSSWIGFAAIAGGIWIGTYMIHIRPLNKKTKQKGELAYGNN